MKSILIVLFLTATSIFGQSFKKEFVKDLYEYTTDNKNFYSDNTKTVLVINQEFSYPTVTLNINLFNYIKGSLDLSYEGFVINEDNYKIEYKCEWCDFVLIKPTSEGSKFYLTGIMHE